MQLYKIIYNYIHTYTYIYIHIHTYTYIYIHIWNVICLGCLPWASAIAPEVISMFAKRFCAPALRNQAIVLNDWFPPELLCGQMRIKCSWMLAMALALLQPSISSFTRYIIFMKFKNRGRKVDGLSAYEGVFSSNIDTSSCPVTSLGAPQESPSHTRFTLRVNSFLRHSQTTFPAMSFRSSWISFTEGAFTTGDSAGGGSWPGPLHRSTWWYRAFHQWGYPECMVYNGKCH